MGALAAVYDPGNKHNTNPLCWPINAGPEDFQGLPPHVISVNQLDPLRDEGLKYYQMLAAAGVSAYSRTVNGTAMPVTCCSARPFLRSTRRRYVTSRGSQTVCLSRTRRRPSRGHSKCHPVRLRRVSLTSRPETGAAAGPPWKHTFPASGNAIRARSPAEEAENRTHGALHDGAAEGVISGQSVAEAVRSAEHPLPRGHPREHVIDEMRHPPQLGQNARP